MTSFIRLNDHREGLDRLRRLRAERRAARRIVKDKLAHPFKCMECGGECPAHLALCPSCRAKKEGE